MFYAVCGKRHVLGKEENFCGIFRATTEADAGRAWLKASPFPVAEAPRILEARPKERVSCYLKRPRAEAVAAGASASYEIDPTMTIEDAFAGLGNTTGFFKAGWTVEMLVSRRQMGDEG